MKVCQINSQEFTTTVLASSQQMLSNDILGAELLFFSVYSGSLLCYFLKHLKHSLFISRQICITDYGIHPIGIIPRVGFESTGENLVSVPQSLEGSY